MRKISILLSSLVLLALGNTPVQAATIKIECRWSHAAPDDPIVHPNQPGAAHLHEFFGNTRTNASSTYASMLGATTTCPFTGDTGAYWVPALMTKDGTRIQPKRMTVYYRDRPLESRPVTPFPPDFRIIAGSPTAGTWGFNCDGTALITTSRIDCSGQSAGHTLVRGTVIFPNCGMLDAKGNVVIDSPDHRSHVAYPTSARLGCPASHPVKLPHLKINVRWGITNCVAAGCVLASDQERGCTVAGCSLHSDFWNTWNQAALITMVQTQLNA